MKTLMAIGTALVLSLTLGLAAADEVWVGSDGDSTITVIDSATNKVVATLSVPRTPHNITFAPDGTFAFATAHAGDTVTMIDATSKKVVGTLPAAALPNKVGVTPDGRELWTGNLGAKNITVVDIKSKEKVATLKAGTTPIYFVFSPDGRRAYVTNWDSNDVSVIDTASRKVVASIPVPKHPIDLRLIPDGRLVVVSGLKGDTGDHAVSIIDTATNKVTEKIERNWRDPRYLVLHPDGKRLFVASRGDNTIAVVDVGPLKVTKEFPGAKNTGLIGLTADGRFLYGVDRDALAAVAIDTESGKVAATVPVGKKPFGLAVRPTGR